MNSATMNILFVYFEFNCWLFDRKEVKEIEEEEKEV